MLSSPATILIGAAGRNVGKTEFACSLIREASLHRKVIGVKVTTVTSCDGSCPRGGRGCGVCSSLKGDFEITEELSAEGTKDTARMLAAGAHRVFWLRVRKEHLDRGIASLYERVPTGSLVVCESNSARKALVPGLFLVIREAGASEIKESCADVIRDADRIIDFLGTAWTLDPAAITFGEAGWKAPPPKDEPLVHRA